MAMVTGVVFAEDTEYEYTVVVNYRYGTSSTILSKTYTVWASSAADAREQATAMCEWEFGSNGSVVSCGVPQVTGRRR